jgi:hypothetical protein
MEAVGIFILGWRFSLVGLGGAIAIGSRRVLSPVDNSASRGGSRDAIPPPLPSDLTLSVSSVSSPHSTLYVRAISRRYRFTRVGEGGSTPSLLSTRGDTFPSELSMAACANG